MKISCLLACLMLVGCAGSKRTHPPHQITPEPVWSEEQQAAYDQCLEDNMAVATAWELIEQRCAEAVAKSDGREPDPLSAS